MSSPGAVAEPIVIPPGGGEVIGDSPDRTVLVLSDRDELHATWSRFGPGRDGADRHIHYGHADLFYVVEGQLGLKLGEDEEATATADTLVAIPPMVVHGFRNASPKTEVKYVNLHAPGDGFIPYMRGLRDKWPIEFDQHDPEGIEGILPSSEVAIGGERAVIEGDGLREALLCELEAVALSDTAAEPEAPAPEPHVHPGHVESFLVLEGEVGFTLGSEEVRAEAGTWVQVPPGLRHTISFPGGSTARLLTLHTPGSGFGAFLRTLADTDGDEPEALARSGFDQRSDGSG